MSEYTSANIPCTLHHGEIMSLEDGIKLRFESNGEAKDIFFGDEWTASVQLFPANTHDFQAGGKTIRLTAQFEDSLTVEYV